MAEAPRVAVGGHCLQERPTQTQKRGTPGALCTVEGTREALPERAQLRLLWTSVGRGSSRCPSQSPRPHLLGDNHCASPSGTDRLVLLGRTSEFQDQAGRE